MSFLPPLPIAAVTDFWVVFMIAGGLLAALVLVFTVGSRHRRTGEVAIFDAHERLERINQTAEVKDELRETMRELEDLARRLNEELDEKTLRLEKLLLEADRRIQALQSGGTTAPAAAAAPKQVEEPVLDPIATKIYALADAGRQPMEIARELNEQIGKVELILALRQQVRR